MEKQYLGLEILENGTYIVSCGNSVPCNTYFNGEEKTARDVVERMKREGGIWLGDQFYQFHRFTKIYTKFVPYND